MIWGLVVIGRGPWGQNHGESLDQISGVSDRSEKYRYVTLLNHNIGVIVAVIYDRIQVI